MLADQIWVDIKWLSVTTAMAHVIGCNGLAVHHDVHDLCICYHANYLGPLGV